MDIILSQENNNNNDNNINITRWKNRRRMAWLCLISMIIVTFILLFSSMSIEKIKAISNIIEWFYLTMASIIGAYMGFTTWSSKINKK
jgi:formate hydrogenlyase subunit 4